MTDHFPDDRSRRRTINVDFVNRSRAKAILAPTQQKLADWQQQVPLYLALVAKQPPSHRKTLARKIEATLNDIDSEWARLESALSDQPELVATNGLVFDARRALEQIRSRLIESQQTCN